MSVFSGIKYELTSKSWWKAASIRALRTGLAAAIPFFVAIQVLDVDWFLGASTVGLSMLVSYLTSLAGLPEVTGDSVNKVLALAVRAIKTFAQVVAGYIGTAVVFQEVNWSLALAMAASATIVSIMNGLISQLPEDEKVLTEA